VTSPAEELSPSYLGEDRIDVTCDTTQKLAAFSPITVGFGYTRCAPEGASLPLELIVQGPNAGSFVRKYFTRGLPSVFIFTPKEGGAHLVRLAELSHNYWFGALVIPITGERLEP
jgi:hypothetical protein